MEQYREAIVREILFRLIPPIIMVLIALIGIVVLAKFIGVENVKHSKLIMVFTMIFIIVTCSLILYFDTKGLFVDLNNNDFVEYHGEVTFYGKKSTKEFDAYRLNDEESTIVRSSKGKIETTIDKCVAHMVYGRNSKFVVVFEVEKVIEERVPINIT